MNQDKINKLDSKGLASLLLKQPQLIDRVNIKKINKPERIRLLKKHAQFIEIFDISNFHNRDIARIVSKQPQLIDRFSNFNLASLNEYCIEVLLSSQPQFAPQVDLSKLTQFLWFEIIKKQSIMANYFDINQFSISNIGQILISHKGELLDKLTPENKSGLYDYHIITILQKNPNLFWQFEVSKLRDIIIAELLISYPYWYDRFDLNKFSGNAIVILLSEVPQLVDQFDLDKLSGSNIAELLSNQPQFIDKLNLNKLNGYDIANLLIAQPQFVDRFDLLQITSSDNLYNLLNSRKELINNADILKALILSDITYSRKLSLLVNSKFKPCENFIVYKTKIAENIITNIRKDSVSHFMLNKVLYDQRINKSIIYHILCANAFSILKHLIINEENMEKFFHLILVHICTLSPEANAIEIIELIYEKSPQSIRDINLDYYINLRSKDSEKMKNKVKELCLINSDVARGRK